MRRAFMSFVALAQGLAVSSALAQPVTDHLKCYKVRDPQRRATYTADVAGLTPEPGCVIKVPAKFTCVPAAKTNVSPTPPGGGPSGVPNGFNCYAVKCPKTTLPTVPVADQFGTRTLTPLAAKMVCAPFAPPTTSTTTTTLPLTCAAGMIACGMPCAGSCRCFGPGTSQFCSGVHCGSFDQACVNVSGSAGAECSFDSACPPGQACVAPSPLTCSATVGGPGHCFPICPE